MTEQEKSDQKQSRIAKILPVLVAITSASIALIALLVGIASRKKEFTCALLGSNSIVSVDRGRNPDIKVEFRGHPVMTLSQFRFSLRNTGAIAIKGTDILEPVKLTFPPEDKILSVIVEGTSPQHFTFNATMDQDSNAALFSFPLLNPGDEAFFSTYVQALRPVRPVFEGRIVDLAQMLYADKSDIESRPLPSFLSSHAVRSTVRWILAVIYVALAVATMVLFFVVLVGDQVRYLRWAKLNRSKTGHYRTFPSSSDVALLQAIAEREQISRPPHPKFNSVSDAVNATLVLWSIVCVSIFTAMIIFTALRG